MIRKRIRVLETAAAARRERAAQAWDDLGILNYSKIESIGCAEEDEALFAEAFAKLEGDGIVDIPEPEGFDPKAVYDWITGVAPTFSDLIENGHPDDLPEPPAAGCMEVAKALWEQTRGRYDSPEAAGNYHYIGWLCLISALAEQRATTSQWT